MDQLKGKIAIVTGASSGIGQGIAIAFGKEGASVVIAARDAAKLKQTADAIVAAGGKAEIVATDVTSEKSIENLFAKTMERFGRLDILVNNAGLFNGAPLDQLTTEAFDAVITTGIRGSFICTRAAFRIMKQQKQGRIINMGSISAQRSRPNNVPYTTAKFGLTGLTHATALEGREFGITCGILHPGQVHTHGPSKMPGMSVEEIAAAAVYMASQPPDVNCFELIQFPIDQPYLGRG